MTFSPELKTQTPKIISGVECIETSWTLWQSDIETIKSIYLEAKNRKLIPNYTEVIRLAINYLNNIVKKQANGYELYFETIASGQQSPYYIKKAEPPLLVNSQSVPLKINLLPKDLTILTSISTELGVANEAQTLRLAILLLAHRVVSRDTVKHVLKNTSGEMLEVEIGDIFTLQSQLIN